MLAVFLDIDGVLNQGAGPGTPELVARLNEITDRTGAVIVVHSSWRWQYDAHQLHTFLTSWGVTGNVFDACKKPEDLRIDKKMPMSSRRDRPLAIQNWLDDHPGLVRQFVILDDSPNLGQFIGTPSFIRTEQRVGLTDEHVDRAVLHLKGVTW
jgi:hypothetical protein